MKSNFDIELQTRADTRDTLPPPLLSSIGGWGYPHPRYLEESTMPGTKHFSRMNYHVQRGLRELLSERYITADEWNLVLSIFDHRCAFCGIEHTGNNRTGLVPDHLIPAVEYGEMCLGNTVPACQDCNDKRGRRPWRSYLSSRFPDAARERTERIQDYLDSYPYSPATNPAHVLAGGEHAEYVRLLEEWEALWQRARALRNVVKRRRKARALCETP